MFNFRALELAKLSGDLQRTSISNGRTWRYSTTETVPKFLRNVGWADGNGWDLFWDLESDEDTGWSHHVRLFHPIHHSKFRWFEVGMIFVGIYFRTLCEALKKSLGSYSGWIGWCLEDFSDFFQNVFFFGSGKPPSFRGIQDDGCQTGLVKYEVMSFIHSNPDIRVNQRGFKQFFLFIWNPFVCLRSFFTFYIF